MKSKRKEVDTQRYFQIYYSKYGRLFKLDNGLAYHKIGREYIPFKYGPGAGVSDLIGFTEIEITEDMIGQKVPVFTAFEVKTETGRASELQKNFIAMVQSYNGIAGIVKTEKEIEEIRENGIRSKK
jgi:hypothetical protein